MRPESTSYTVVSGSSPGPIAPALAEHFDRVGFTVRTVAGTGHFVHLDDHEGFVAALDGWV
ncbi:hypothetical protein AB0F91_22985 [Amycolatopsis sp. NPDC023774]|uniref:hypothetical protein n=1 Tax=Amycolatopsis sp. NPDC023774 TaxID=3155015 RepID=UPI0033E0078F